MKKTVKTLIAVGSVLSLTLIASSINSSMNREAIIVDDTLNTNIVLETEQDEDEKSKSSETTVSPDELSLLMADVNRSSDQELFSNIPSSVDENIEDSRAEKGSEEKAEKDSKVSSSSTKESTTTESTTTTKAATTTTTTSTNATTTTQTTTKSLDQIVSEVVNGQWGNGSERISRLNAAGYDYELIQEKIEEVYPTTTTTRATTRATTRYTTSTTQATTQATSANATESSANEVADTSQTTTVATTPVATTVPVPSGNGYAIANLAKRLVGYPYIFGTAGPYAFDCSGLVKYVFANVAGLNLPHGATAQSYYGYNVGGLYNAQPGDVIFFGYPGSAYHCGIVVGNGRYVHAATPQLGVIYGNLFDGWTTSNVFAVKRFV